MTGRLLEALGGEGGCRKLSVAFYARVAGDPDLKPLFPGKSLRCATEEFAAFLIQFLGGDEEMTQYRWWLSLRESHARFRIMESQRVAWLRQMEATLRSSGLDGETQVDLLQFFQATSTYVVGGEAQPVGEPELAERWERAKALDLFAADIVAGHDGAVLTRFRDFASQPCLFTGVLSRMLETRRPPLVSAVVEAIEGEPALGTRRYAGRSLLHAAAGAGCPEVVAALLGLGVDANLPDWGGHPPLYRLANECANEAGPEIARMLVRAGADVNRASGVTRATALHMAARRGFVRIARALLECGASPTVRDAKGATPLDRAVNCRKPEVARLLRG